MQCMGMVTAKVEVGVGACSRGGLSVAAKGAAAPVVVAAAAVAAAARAVAMAPVAVL